MYLISVGSPYEIDCDDQDCGARVDILAQHENVLQIIMPDIQKVEVDVILNGSLSCGMLFKNSAINLLWRFKKDGLDPMFFETPFDVRLIEERMYIDITDVEFRPVFTIHLIESNSKICKGLRSITMHKDLALKLMSAVQDQAASFVESMPQNEQWKSYTIDTLFAMSDKYRMGE